VFRFRVWRRASGEADVMVVAGLRIKRAGAEFAGYRQRADQAPVPYRGTPRTGRPAARRLGSHALVPRPLLHQKPRLLHHLAALRAARVRRCRPCSAVPSAAVCRTPRFPRPVIPSAFAHPPGSGADPRGARWSAPWTNDLAPLGPGLLGCAWAMAGGMTGLPPSPPTGVAVHAVTDHPGARVPRKAST
jgi:hypothetical protein